MIIRILIALIGAALITGGMLLGMSEFAAVFRQRDTDKYFLVTDIIRRELRGRPDRPGAAQLPPERTAPELERDGPRITVESPGDPADISIGAAPAIPELDAESGNREP